MLDFKSKIKTIADFPKKGVQFLDIMPLLVDHLPEVIESLCEGTNWEEVDYVVGIESRGFILAAAMASYLRKGFIPVRKPGKLPPPAYRVEYQLEYGSDVLEMAKIPEKKGQRVIIVDDVLATGGTLKATYELCRQNNLEVIKNIMFINLTFLNKLKEDPSYPIKSVLEY